jgi:hypothetical protein
MKRKPSKDPYLRTLTFLIAYIITVSVFIPYNRIPQETFAKQDSDDNDGGDSNGGDSNGGDSNGGDSNGGDSNGGDSNGGDSNGGDSNGDDQKGNTDNSKSGETGQEDGTRDQPARSNELARSRDGNGMGTAKAIGGDLASGDGLAQPSSSMDIAGPDGISSGRTSHDSTSHDIKEEHKFRHNAQDIAAELSNLTPQEISEYPITDLSNNDIIMVMGFLEPGDLTRVLLHIPQADLASIEHRISPHTFNEFINRLSELDKNQVEARLLSTTSIG